MRPIRIVQTGVGVIGFVSVFGSAFFGSAFGWNADVSLIVSLALGIGTVGIELTLSFSDLKESIVKLYPSLDFSVAEQRQIYGLISNLNALREDGGPAANIALAHQAQVSALVSLASSRSDFETDNTFGANLEALKTLRPGERFIGLSAILNPDHWDYDPELIEYKKLNYQQASIGVMVQRTFILKDEEEHAVMTRIMQEQADHGIDVAYVYERDLPKSQFFLDFTILPEHQFALYVPKIDKLLTCIATQNSSIIAELEQTMNRIRTKSTNVEVTK